MSLEELGLVLVYAMCIRRNSQRHGHNRANIIHNIQRHHGIIATYQTLNAYPHQHCKSLTDAIAAPAPTNHALKATCEST
jgi:hypothetical protein